MTGPIHDKIVCCDNCGDPHDPAALYHYGRLPFPVASANEGESASICHDCQTQLNGDNR